MLQVCGHPEPQVTWYRQGRALTGGERRVMEQSGRGNFSLVVSGVTEDDLGRYTCQANNKAGSRQVTVEILLEGLNTHSTNTTTDNTATNTQVTFTCNIHSLSKQLILLRGVCWSQSQLSLCDGLDRCSPSQGWHTETDLLGPCSCEVAVLTPHHHVAQFYSILLILSLFCSFKANLNESYPVTLWTVLLLKVLF